MEAVRTDVRRRRRWPAVVIGLLAAMALVVVVGAWVGERWVNARVQREAATLEAQLGRPVRVGHVDLRLLPGPEVVITDVLIGGEPGAGADRPALQVPRVAVDVRLFRSLLSLGKSARVEELRVDRPQLTVVRFEDGTTNWQRIAARRPQPTEEPAPMTDATRERVRGFVLEQALLTGARLLFVDRQAGGRTAEVRDLDVAINDFGLAQGGRVRVDGSVLADKRNLSLEALLGPSPDEPGRLPPPALERLALKMQPTELGPVLPMVTGAGALVDLQAGRFGADLLVQAGDGVRAPMIVRGWAALERGHFAGGEPFDARLTSQLTADPAAGQIDVKSFVAQLGAMRLEAKGAMRGLDATPRFDGFALTSSGLDFSTLHRYWPGLDRAAGVVLRGPFTVGARAEEQGGAQVWKAKVDLTAASMVAPGQAQKPAGTRFLLEAEGRAQPDAVLADRIDFAFGQATVRGRGALRGLAANRARRFEATAEADPIAVRPLLALVAPAQAATVPAVIVGGRLSAQGTLGRPETMKIDVPAFSVNGERSRIEGRASVQNLRAPTFSVTARAPYLDVDEFKPEKPTTRAAATTTRPTSARPKDDPMARAQGRADVTVAAGRASGIDFRDLRADVTVANGRATARTLEVSAFGGRFSGAGTELPVTGEGPFALRGQLTGMQIGALLARFAGHADVVRGALDARLDLGGRGTTPDELRRSLTGTLAGRLNGAELSTTSVLGGIARDLARVVRIPALAGLLNERAAALSGDRTFGTLAGAVRFAQGAMTLTRPLEAQTPHGPMTLRGQVALDGRLDLLGSLALSPQAASTLVAGRVSFADPVPVELRLTGPVTSPQVGLARPDQVARAFAAAWARSDAARAVESRARRGAERVLEGAGRKTDVPPGVQQKAREAAGRRLRGILGR